MRSANWAHEYAFEQCKTTGKVVRDLLAQSDRMLADARVDAVSVPSRYTLAHGAVVLLARLALNAAGYRTLESHHYWALESLKHTVGLDDQRVDILQAHRAKRHDAIYGADPRVTATELEELLGLAGELRDRVTSWVRTEHRDLWDPGA